MARRKKNRYPKYENVEIVDLAIDGKCTKYKQGSTVIEITENKVKILR